MNTTSAVVPIPISNILTHTKFHLDEVAAVRLLQKHGEKFFPGVSNAPVRFSEGVEAKPDASFDTVQILPVGCVHGTRFNDKDSHGRRIPDQCTTTLVYEYLGLNGDTALRKITDDVLRCDTKLGVKSTELPEVIKMGHRQRPNEFVWTWATTILDAIHSRLSLGLARVSSEPTLKDIFEQLVGRKRFPDDRSRNRLSQLVAESMKRKDNIMELAFFTECLFRAGTKDAQDYIQFALENLYADQIEFWKKVEECRVSRNYFMVPLFNGQYVVDLSVLYIQSDSPHMLRASRHQQSGAAGVTILRNSKGQVGVFADRDRQGLDLDEFVAMVRWTELHKGSDGMPLNNVSWEALKVDGEVEQVSHWHYSRNAQQFMNGSLSHPGVLASEIASQFFIDLAYCAFDPYRVSEWKRRRNIKYSVRIENPVLSPEDLKPA